jgi:hypothetical protein
VDRLVAVSAGSTWDTAGHFLCINSMIPTLVGVVVTMRIGIMALPDTASTIANRVGRVLSLTGGIRLPTVGAQCLRHTCTSASGTSRNPSLFST